MKRVDTMVIEKVLQQSLFGTNPKLAKEYGTTEVTLSSLAITDGKEIVDFLSYEPNKNLYRCYEIKVSMQDFHSKAKKSWYGDLNYLVLSEELYMQQPLEAWKAEIPSYVGIVVVNTATAEKQTLKRAFRQRISVEQATLLKDSLLRTLFYQNQNDNWYLRK